MKKPILDMDDKMEIYPEVCHIVGEIVLRYNKHLKEKP